MSNPVIAEVVRNGHVESWHRGSALAVRADGSVALALGDVDRPTFPRSSNKPLQAVGMLEAGWVPRRTEHVAVASASHSGEPEHLRVVLDLLGGLGPSALGCPAMPPVDEAAWHQLLREGGAASSLTMNCSGKHAAMLATCVANGWPLKGYLEPEHPVQQACLAAIERLSGERVTAVVVDGCGAPQHALSLRGLARAFGQLAVGGPLERSVGEAMRAHPWLVGGTGREATRLMEGIDGCIAKDGAEGVFAVALADGSAAVVKVDDGAFRARGPVLVAALRALGAEAAVLDELAAPPVLGGGQRVGEVRFPG